MRIFGRRASQRLVLAGGDDITVGFPLPAGCELKNVWLNVKLIGTEGESITTAVMYGYSGFVVPVLDPATLAYS